jgi:hypothetical protein
MSTLREWITAENRTLPPIAAKETLEDGTRRFVPEELATEQANYTAIVADFNAANIRELQPFVLGRLGIVAIFGAVRGAEILGALTAAAVDNPVLTELLAWMAPGAPGVDVGTADATTLLSSLVQANVITSNEKATLDTLRTRQVTVTELDAWNQLHTWIDGRPE